MLVKLTQLDPTLWTAQRTLGVILLADGRPEEALSVAERVTAPAHRLAISAAAFHALGRKAESDDAVAKLISASAITAYQIAEVYAFRGEADGAFEWLQRSIDQREGGLMGFTVDPFLDKIRGDARYAAFLKKVHLES